MTNENINLEDPDVIREMKENPYRNVAVVGLINESGNILLIRTVRFPNNWQPVGGGKSPEDKTLIDTLIREVKEEAGVDLQPQVFRYEITTKYDFGEGEVHFFTAEIKPSTKINLDESQILDWRWLPIKEALKLPMFPATHNFIIHLLSKSIQT